MRKFPVISRFRAMLPLCVLVAFFACNKDHDKIAGPDISTGANGGKDTITLGHSLSIVPVVVSPGVSTYAWTLDGSAVSTDTAYTFTPAGTGDFNISVTVSNSGGTATQEYDIHVYGQYENGFFLVNEGWYGHGSGTLGFYRYDTQTLEDSVFTKANPGKDLDPNTSTLEFGMAYNDRIYLLSKIGGPLVQLDAISLKETARIAAGNSNDFRALLPVDTTLAILGTGDGLFKLNLQTLAVGAAIPGIAGETGDMMMAGNYIFVLSASDGLDILHATDYSIAKNSPGITVGLARSLDGMVWAAGGDSLLVKIDPSTLDTGNVKLPFEINGTFGYWHPGSITASAKENAVYIAYNQSYTGATAIYKYVDGTPSSNGQPFIQITAGKELYGSGLSYNAAKDELVVSTVESGYGTHYSVNDLNFYSPADGTQIKDIPYTGYFFPAMAFFH